MGGAILILLLLAAGLARYPLVFLTMAAAVVGQVAFTGGRFVAMGIALHFAIAIFWALVYALIAGQLGLLRRWMAGGAILGLVAWAAMQQVQIYVHLRNGPPPWRLALAVAAFHVFFFGWPLARLLRDA